MSDEPSYFQALNPEQKQAVMHQGSPLLILAGAGSGKTRVVTRRIANLLEQSKQIIQAQYSRSSTEQQSMLIAGIHVKILEDQQEDEDVVHTERFLD